VGYRIDVTSKAERDLQEIYRYIAFDNPSAAHRFRLQLTTQLKLISNFARAGRMVPEIGRKDIRELIRNPYRIIYRVKENQKLIEVLRFWHAARGIPKI
jgi:toxin ParE1/3/4